jgi:hypothetical protein
MNLAVHHPSKESLFQSCFSADLYLKIRITKTKFNLIKNETQIDCAWHL